MGKEQRLKREIECSQTQLQSVLKILLAFDVVPERTGTLIRFFASPALFDQIKASLHNEGVRV